MHKAMGGPPSIKWLPVMVVGVIAFTFLPLSQARGQTPTPILVELFTSEGCSSCPPAEAFLGALDRTQPISGARLIVLEEHVDYWDGQGWRDPFSAHAFTVRQIEYEQRLHVGSGPYTPQMVVDGTYQLVANDRRGATQVFERARAAPKVTVEISSVEVSQGKLLAHVATAPVSSKADVIAAIAFDQAQSDVLRGENHGRHLEHVAVVHELLKIGKVAKGQSFSKDVSFTLGASRQPYRLISLVEEPDQGKVLGAALARVPQ